MGQLKGLEKVTEFLRLAFASGNIEGEKPISALLVAPVSNGKTTAIKQFRNNKSILITTDTTAYGILEKYGSNLKSRELRHIVIPDLLNALVRRKSTVETFLLFINASSEDGIFPSKTFAYDVKDFIEPFGWILCVTKEAYERKKKFLESVGFLSRFFIINYQYNLATLQEILNNIINERNIEIPSVKVGLHKKKKKILGNKEIFEKLNVYAKLLSSEKDGSILRVQKKLQVLAKSNAYLRGDNKVTMEDLKKVEELLEVFK